MRAREPERVLTVLVRFAKAPERLAIFAVFCPTVPDNELTVLIIGVRVNAKILMVFERVATVPVRVFTVFVRLIRLPETVVRAELSHEIVPERAFCARKSVK